MFMLHTSFVPSCLRRLRRPFKTIRKGKLPWNLHKHNYLSRRRLRLSASSSSWRFSRGENFNTWIFKWPAGSLNVKTIVMKSSIITHFHICKSHGQFLGSVQGRRRSKHLPFHSIIASLCWRIEKHFAKYLIDLIYRKIVTAFVELMSRLFPIRNVASSVGKTRSPHRFRLEFPSR